MRKRSIACASVPTAAAAAVLAGGTLAVGAAVQEEVPAEIIAAQVRRQGFPCEEALSAERESHAPNAAVWVLRCSNATYRVQLTPNMAARVERIE
jgi:hypothetical protein